MCQPKAKQSRREVENVVLEKVARSLFSLLLDVNSMTASYMYSLLFSSAPEKCSLRHKILKKNVHPKVCFRCHGPIRWNGVTPTSRAADAPRAGAGARCCNAVHISDPARAQRSSDFSHNVRCTRSAPDRRSPIGRCHEIDHPPFADCAK